MKKYWIEFSDAKYGLISRYVIPKWMIAKYINQGCTIYFPDGYEEVAYQQYCDLCVRMKSETTKQQLTVCQDKNINHNLGHPAKICLDCYYYLEYESGNHSIPKSIKTVIESGFRPTKLDNLRYM